ncbi:MAG: hypothetical protein JW963_02360 [Anaerolineales bacterium]|nr:hypothetical protein [Anaerolineales bacterium]
MNADRMDGRGSFGVRVAERSRSPEAPLDDAQGHARRVIERSRNARRRLRQPLRLRDTSHPPQYHRETRVIFPLGR